jgi:hypothetical protein
MICVWRQQVCRFKITKEDGVSKRRLKKIQKKDLLFANVNKNTKSGKLKEEQERKKKGAKGDLYDQKRSLKCQFFQVWGALVIIYRHPYWDAIM